ncbi:MAG: AMP-binding protein [Sphingobium sp.]
MSDALSLPGGGEQRVIGVVAVDGGQFAEAVFSIENEGAVSVQLRGLNDQERIEALGISEIRSPAASTGWVTPASPAELDPDLPARLVHSSGTTGTAKTILVTHGNIATTSERLVAEMGMTAGIREYIGVPLTYSFGLGRARAVALAGGQYYVPPHGFDPSEIADMLRAGEINAISAVPTLWRVLIANADILGKLGAGVRWIEIGSQAMSVDEKLAMRALFPNAKIVQHYGLTEASRTTFLHIDSCTEAELSSVGKPGTDINVEIGETGLIRISGPHVAPWRLDEGEWTPLTGSDGWLTTGDFGHIENGHLFFEGRADDLINCGGTKISPDAMERAIAVSMGLSGADADRIAVTRVPDALRGEAVLVAFERGAGLATDGVRNAALEALAGQGLTVGSVLKVEQVAALPRTATGKLARRELTSAWVDDTLSGGKVEQAMDAPVIAPAEEEPSGGEDISERLLALWRTALGRDDIDPTKSFYDVGGDSLSAIGLALAMERAGFDPETARSIFEGRTIAEIAGATAPAKAAAQTSVTDEGVEHHTPDFAEPLPEAKTRSETSQVAVLSEGLNIIKGWLIICMVSSHWLPLYLGRVGLQGSIGHKAIQPFLSMGSPTLSFCFGIGAAIFYARQYRASQTSFRRSIRTGTILLFAGLLIGGLLETAARVASGETWSPGVTISALAGGPFLYFMLATLSLPLWVGRIGTNLRSVLWLAGMGVVAYLLFEIGRRTIHLDPDDLTLSGIERILVGHWSLAQMSAFTLIGAATGVVIEMMIARKKPLSLLAPFGLLLVPAGVVLALAADDLGSWFTPHENIIPWAVVSYIGITLYVVGRVEAWKVAIKDRPVPRAILETVATLGILLFPIYIVQSVVYHGTEFIADVSGLKFLQVLTVMIAIWFALTVYGVRRMHRLYYGRTRKS